MSERHIKVKKVSAERNLKLFAFASFIRMLGVSAIDLILVIYAINLGADAILSGIAVGAFSITQVLFQIPVAKLSDKIGRKHTLLIGMSVFATGTLLCGLAQNIYHLIVFRLVQGSGAYISVIQTFIGDLFSSEKRGRAMSYYQSGVTLGYAVGLPLGGFFASLFLNLPFFVNFGFILTSIILIYIFVDDSQTFNNNMNTEKNQKINYRKKFLRNRLFLLIIFTDCLLVFVFSSLLVFSAPFAHSFGLDTFEFSIVMVGFVLMMTLGFYLGGRYSDRVSRSNTIFFGLLIAGCFLLTLSIINTPIELVLIGAGVFLGIGIVWPTIPALVLDSIPESCRATGISIYNVFRYSSNALGPIIIGYIIGIFSLSPDDLGQGIRVSYLISGIIYFLACLVVFFFLRKYERGRKIACNSNES
ncbi:MAG: MFS transporter [Candidatus Helarchaeota archaeon]|nr:MFS transporter [Candidatus Helarchaeota archaeon]